jgi:enoyl-CoA hydratase
MPVEFSRDEEFAVVTINRPDALNALNEEILLGLDDAFRQAGTSDARALLITGAGGKAFCAGADIKGLSNDFRVQRANITMGQSILERLAELPITSVALINGFALGGGLELATACTFRLAAPHAKMGLPEIKLGMIPGYGGTQRLPRLIGESRAMELIMTGRFVDAAEAERIGLVNRIVEGDLLATGKAFARTFTGFSLPALHLIRSAVGRALETPLHEGLKLEADVTGIQNRSDDAAEGRAAFVEKRKAVFRDR